MTIGILPLGRDTFDVPFAEARLEAMLNRLDAAGYEYTGPRELLLDANTARAALEDVLAAGSSRLLVLQVTFTDATLTLEAAGAGIPISIWAIPEPRAGDRLRLNAFCGLNLASHALGLRGYQFSWAYADPTSLSVDDLEGLLNAPDGPRETPSLKTYETASKAAERILDHVKGRSIALIGEPPSGFDTCYFDNARLKALAGIEVDAIPLPQLFERARAAKSEAVELVRQGAASVLEGMEEVDQAQLDRSLRLKVALDAICEAGGYGAVAIRCWPEAFTEYGGAVCGPVSMMGEEQVPCACEADVYGAVTQLVLQKCASAPVFLTDVVDIDTDDDTAVVWHCGQAPISMRDPEYAATATVHSNRKMPLLCQFPLKPGRVTLMRISQALGKPKMVLAGGEVLKRPMPFAGTSGTLKFDRPARNVLNDLLSGGVEHHLGLAYGDHRGVLREVAAGLRLPVLEL